MRSLTFVPGAARTEARWCDDQLRALRPDEVLIDVAASAVNRADLLQRNGAYAPPPGESAIPGLECAGTVVKVGPAVTAWRVGDPVCALLASGGHATQAIASSKLIMAVPRGWAWTEAAAFPEAAGAAWWALCQMGQITAGSRLLVHGGNSGVGTCAIRLALALGAVVTATVRGAHHERAVLDLGARAVVRSDLPDLDARLAQSAPDGYDVVLDLVGGALAPATQQCLAMDGRWVILGIMSGRQAQIDLQTLIRRRATIRGGSLRSLPADRKAAIVSEIAGALGSLADLVRPVVSHVIPYTDAQQAFDLLESTSVLGKIALDFHAAGPPPAEPRARSIS